MIPFIFALLAVSIVADVRRAINAGDLPGAERLVNQFQKDQGVTPESLEALSWLARGALGAKNLPQAQRFAAETKKQVLARVNSASLDAEPHLPIALGAAIEVQAQVLDATEGRAASLAYLTGELQRYKTTSIRTRIQKNINLLSLEGKKAPPLEGVELPKNRPVLLFFWAHWCPDCKAEAPVIAEMQGEFPELAIIGPTQLYGYVGAGREVPQAEERAYIAGVRQKFYGVIRDMPAPVNEENFKVYGASSTPTIVLVDRTGIVRMYHPGRMTAEELRSGIQKIVGRS